MEKLVYLSIETQTLEVSSGRAFFAVRLKVFWCDCCSEFTIPIWFFVTNFTPFLLLCALTILCLDSLYFWVTHSFIFHV